jgi:putative transposase
MQIKKTLKIPVHYATTKFKKSILDNTTARITFCIQSISSLITDDTELTRKNIRRLVKENKIAEKTKLSAGFVDQCVDKTIWSWKSYKRLHDDWLRRLEKVVVRDNEVYLWKFLQKEPTPPSFNHKNSCRIDERTGKIQWNKKSKLSSLWVHLSTLKKGQTVDIPLNPAHYHLKQLKDTEIKDFELIKKDNKYQVHISLEKEIAEKHVSSVGGIDQGLNHSAGIVLLPSDQMGVPFEGLLCDEKKQEILQKYDHLISVLQNAEQFGKLKQLKNKRLNVAKEYDWQIANQITKLSDGVLIGIGDADFRQTQYRGNGMPTLRKRIGKWSYARQRQFIALRRAEQGYDTLFVSEQGSNNCYRCGSHLVNRKWLPSGESYILCHSCGMKKDADINSAYHHAYITISRCQDERLKAGMTMGETRASL